MKQTVHILILTSIFVTSVGWGSGWAAQHPESMLSVRDNLLSANMKRVTLVEAMNALAQKMDLAVSVDSSVAHDVITVAFESSSLEEAIRHILGTHSYALTFAPKPAGNQLQVVAINVYRKAAAPAQSGVSQETLSEPLPVKTDGETATCNRHTGTDVKTQTAKDQDNDSVSGLQDEDSRQRETSLETLADMDIPIIPIEPLTNVALTDSDPQLRMHALELLDERGGDNALGPLMQAVQDPDPAVSLLAKGLLMEHKVAAETLLETLRGQPL